MSSEEVSQRNHGTWSLPGKKRANRPEKSPSPADPDPFLPSRVGQSSLFARRVQVKLNCACEWGSIFRPFEADVGRCKWEEVKFHSLECTIFDVWLIYQKLRRFFMISNIFSKSMKFSSQSDYFLKSLPKLYNTYLFTLTFIICNIFTKLLTSSSWYSSYLAKPSPNMYDN
jgi:hypothetical protein